MKESILKNTSVAVAIKISASAFVSLSLLLDLRKNEAITVDPIWVLWVESHELVEENVSHRGHTHGRARVARVSSDGGIDLWMVRFVSVFFLRAPLGWESTYC
jgi:hypothetical protein